MEHLQEPASERCNYYPNPALNAARDASVPLVERYRQAKIHETTSETLTPGDKEFKLFSNVIYPNGEIQASNTVIRALISANNASYRFGYQTVFFFFLLVTAFLSPFLGGVVAVIDWTFMLVRAILRPIGKLIADLLGYGTLVDLASQKMMKDLDV